MSSRQVIAQGEVWNFSQDGTDDHASYVIVVWTDGQGRTFRTLHPGRLNSFRLDELPATDPLPIALARAPWQMRFTVADPAVVESPAVYLKTPELLSFDPKDEAGLRELYRAQEAEIAVYEDLQAHPHPNICGYLGCMCEDGRVAGLVLRRYPHSLEGVMQSGAALPDKALVLANIRAALEHLHALGYVHNDVNPGSILLNEDGRAVLADFGFAGREGELKDVNVGTSFWSQKSVESRRESDWFSLELVGRWMDGERPSDETWPLKHL